MHFLLWTKGSHENTNFDTFKCSDENLPHSSCHFPNHKSIFSSNFAWLCSVVKYNSSVLFEVKHFILCTKETNQNANFLDFLVLQSKFTKLLSFLKQKISFSTFFFSNFAPLFDIMGRISSILFLVESLYTSSKSSLSK